jgi:molybdenum cofactor biosynthesis enzyme MoaA
VRNDLAEIVREVQKKAKLIGISTNGFFTGRIVELCKRYPDLGIRIIIEGLQESNDLIRGIPDGSRRTQGTLKQLQALGMKDIGFAMTVQDVNYKDLFIL